MSTQDVGQRVGWPRKLWVMFNVHYAEMLQYRAEIALWAIATMLPLIMMGIWAEAGKSGEFSFNAVQMYRYFIVVFIVRQFTIAWIIHHFEWLVVTGRLSPMLLHPIDPCIRFILMHLGEQWTRVPFVVLIVGGVLFLYPETITGGEAEAMWWPGWTNILLAVVACYMAFLLRFFMQYTLCMAAFWYERVSALDAVQYLPFMFLSGLVFPFQELPAGVQEVLLWTPFPYTIWFPVSLVVYGEAPIVRGFVTISVWILIFFVASRLLWRKGLKHYSAMGA